MGEEPLGATSRIESVIPPIGTPLLLAEMSEVRKVCNTVTGASLFGKQNLTISNMPDLLVSMPILLMQKLRDYDLILGASLLRTLKYLDANVEEEADYATEFLASQQQSDGRFGYYARELVEGPRLRNADQDLYLPVSVSVLWALAEISVPGFSLVGQGAQRCSTAASPILQNARKYV